MEPAREYFWGCELTKENPSVTWSFEEEEGDTDYLIHTLFLKHAVLGTSAVGDERNIVQIETKNFDNAEIKQPLLSLTLGKLDMCTLDVSFGHEVPVTFRLIEGSGPVNLAAQQLVEFPDEANQSQNESELECTETEEEDLEAEEEEESPAKGGKPKKRKAASQGAAKLKLMDCERIQALTALILLPPPPDTETILQLFAVFSKGKMEVNEPDSEEESEEDEDDEELDEEDEEEDMEEEDDEDEDEEEDDEESSPEKSGKKAKSKRGGKEKEKKAVRKGSEKAKVSPKKTTKKGKKVGKK